MKQRRNASDPLLQEIFEIFAEDEIRHAHAAQMLADHYNVHQYKVYETNTSLRRFAPHFVRAIQYVAPHVAAAYITCGELLLDMALLRSINDFAMDDMSQQVIDRINRDESRHVAVDYYMAEFYASDEYFESLRSPSGRPLRERVRIGWIYLCMGFWARPFIRDVFFKPMDRMDPSGERLRQAFKHVQLFGAKPGIARHADAKLLMGVQNLVNNTALGRWIGSTLAGLIGMEPRFLEPLHTKEEAKRAESASFQALAGEALSANPFRESTAL